MLVISALERQRQEDHKFEVSLLQNENLFQKQ
jgi:hypothetical protein